MNLEIEVTRLTEISGGQVYVSYGESCGDQLHDAVPFFLEALRKVRAANVIDPILPWLVLLVEVVFFLCCKHLVIRPIKSWEDIDSVQNITLSLICVGVLKETEDSHRQNRIRGVERICPLCVHFYTLGLLTLVLLCFSTISRSRIAPLALEEELLNRQRFFIPVCGLCACSNSSLKPVAIVERAVVAVFDLSTAGVLI
jgi:hypothetical protein